MFIEYSWSYLSFLFYACAVYSVSLLAMKLILSVKAVEFSRLRTLFCLHVTQVTNGFHHMSRTFFWRTQFIRNMNNPCDNKMTMKLHYIELQMIYPLPQSEIRIFCW